MLELLYVRRRKFRLGVRMSLSVLLLDYVPRVPEPVSMVLVLAGPGALLLRKKKQW